MKRLSLALLLVVAPVAPSIDAGLLPSTSRRLALAPQQCACASCGRQRGLRGREGARHGRGLECVPGELSDRLLRRSGARLPQEAQDAGAAPPQAPAQDAGAKPETGSSANLGDLAPTDPGKPAVTRGGRYMGFAEKFNRYYTDPAWKPSRVVYVSPNGSGNGASRDTPTSVRAAVQAARAGTQIYFLRGKYQGCFEFTKENSGTYDDPIVLYAERNEDKTLGVAMTCCNGGRQTCFNFEAADYVAVDGFELIGGRYGVRAIGAGYAASQHSRGIAVIDCLGHDQNNDPFISGSGRLGHMGTQRRPRRESGRRPRHLPEQRRRLEHRPLQ